MPSAKLHPELKSLPNEFILCRSRHLMDLFNDPGAPPATRSEQIITYRCLRCATRRWDTIDPRSGRLVRRKYFDYPDGYLRQKGEPYIFAVDLRVEIGRRITQYGSVEGLLSAVISRAS